MFSSGFKLRGSFIVDIGISCTVAWVFFFLLAKVSTVESGIRSKETELLSNGPFKRFRLLRPVVSRLILSSGSLYEKNIMGKEVKTTLNISLIFSTGRGGFLMGFI